MSHEPLLGASRVPGVITRSVEHRAARKTQRGRDGDVNKNGIGGNVEDDRTSVVSRIYPGLVVVTDPDTDTLVNADPDVVYSEPAEVVATVDVSVGGNALTLEDPEGGVLYENAAVAGANNAAAVATLNADADFALFFVADNATGKVRIRARQSILGYGAESAFSASGTFATAVSFPTGVQVGVTADYAIVDTGGPTDLVLDGQNVTQQLNCAVLGDFFEGRIPNLGPEARMIFEKRGSLFY